MFRTFLASLCLVNLFLAAACGDDGATKGDAAVGAEDDGSTATCESQLLCDGLQRVTRDGCSGDVEVLETCPQSCFRGLCVACAPGAGRLCVGDELRDIDSCGTTGALVETCESGCRAGACVDATCEPDASRECVEDTVYTRDSCGNLGDAVQVCERGCTDGACVDCTPNAFSQCYEGDIYAVDSCLALGERVEECAETCEFDGASVRCVAGRTCTPNDRVTCFAGNIHHVDSCGNVQEDIQMDCPSGCGESGCLPCVPVTVGSTCVGNDRHELIGGCPDAAPRPGEMLETCMNGCREGSCLPPGCVPDVGVVCSEGNVHATDSCGVVGDLVDTCMDGCELGACRSTAEDAGTTRPDAGAESRPDAGGTSSGICRCESRPDDYPPVDCRVGEARCGGCLGWDDFCESDACTSCEAEFSCRDGAVYMGDARLLDCASCPDCGNPSLCESVCPME